MDQYGKPEWVLTDPKASDAALLVRRARAQLLKHAGTVTASMVARARSCSYDEAVDWVRERQLAGQLIAVSHDGELLVPTFQLDDVFDPADEISKVIGRLRSAGLDDWAIWHWFYAHNSWIGSSPVEAASEAKWRLVERAVEGLVGQ